VQMTFMVSFLELWETASNVSAVDYYAAYAIVVFPLPLPHLSPLFEKQGKFTMDPHLLPSIGIS
jgi:hypothetical protein